MKGFTVLEILVGVVIMSMIGVLTFGATQGTIRTQRSVEEISQIQDEGSVLINKILEDFEKVFYVDAPNRTTQFRGQEMGTKDLVAFTTLSHHPSKPQSHESDQALVVYAAEDNPANSGTLLLKRYEEALVAPKPLTDKIDTSNFPMVSTNVTAFNVEYFDGNDYKTEWDALKPETLHKLPKLIRITLSLKDDKGRERIFQSTTDVPMSESLSVTSSASANPSANSSNPGLSSNPRTGAQNSRRSTPFNRRNSE